MANPIGDRKELLRLIYRHKTFGMLKSHTRQHNCTAYLHMSQNSVEGYGWRKN